MDAKPQRPVRAFAALAPRNENHVAVLGNLDPSHNRQKSAGNIQNMATIGLKGPAKRTAFGDVSNTAGNMIRIDGKHMVKNTSVNTVCYAMDNKENSAQSNEAFLRPPQRPSQGPKPSSAPVQAPAALGSSFHPLLSTSGESQQQATKKASMIYRDGQESHNEKASMPPQLPTLSRHYRSQPQLKKTEAPVLRRTQSRHLDKVEEFIHVDDDVTEASYEDALEELSREEDHHISSDTTQEYISEPAVDLRQSLPDPQEPPVTYEMAPLLSLPAAVPLPSFHSSETSNMGPPILSEPEEYWDEEEDEDLYDEQGYTTAHSYRSHGDNTTGGATVVLAPKVTAKIQKELDEARILTETSLSQEDIDEEEWDVSMVAEYGEEIFSYMRDLEMRMVPDPHYMDIQTEIQWSMRSVLMDWLVQVHNRFSLLPETLFLTVNYIDRFLSRKIVSLGKLQLVGATAIFVAAKYEEINCPSVQEIVFMVDGGYTVDEILKAERFMLSMLCFELGWPGPMSFLRRISKADDYDLETRTLAKYFLEVTIMDERFVSSPPSYLAAGAHCLARLMLKKGDWSPAHVHWSGYTWSQLKPLVSMILECCQSPQKHHNAVYEKYCDRRFKRAAAFVEEQIGRGFTLPYHHSLPRPSMASNIMDDDSALMRYPPPQTSGLLIPIEG